MDHSAGQSDLQHWLIHKLTPICDADPTVLSEYVMALLKPEEPETELIASCESRLEDFLQAETKPFVADLFDHLRRLDRPSPTRSYQPVIEPSMSSTSSGVVLGKRPFLAEHFLLSPVAPLNSLSEPPQGAGSLASPPIPQYTPTQSHPSFLHFPDSEPRPPYEAVPTTRIQPFVSPPHQSRLSKRPRRSGMCRDYHYRGYCARGDGCLFSHDDKDSTSGSGAPFGAGYRPDRVAPDGASAPALPPGPSLPGQYIPGLSTPLAFPNEHGPAHYAPPGHAAPNGPPARFGGPLSAPAQRKSTTTLVVENIPQASLSDRAVRAYFSTFGPLSSVSVDVYHAQALVTFSAAEDAKRAYGSPTPVFNNRFVKIHFKRLTEHSARRGAHGHAQSHAQGGRGGAHMRPSVDGNVQPMPTDQTGGVADCLALSEREKELRVKIDAQKRVLEQLRLKKELMKGIEGNGNGNGSGAGGEGETKGRCGSEEEGVRDGEDSGVGGQNTEMSWSTEPQPSDLAASTTTYKRPLSVSQPHTPRPFDRRLVSSSTPSIANRTIVGNTRTSWTPNGHTVNGSGGGGGNKTYKIDNRAREVVVWGVGREEERVEKVRRYLELFGPIEESELITNKKNNNINGHISNNHNGAIDQNGSSNHHNHDGHGGNGHLEKGEDDEGENGGGDLTGGLKAKFLTRVAAEKAVSQGSIEVSEVGRLSICWFLGASSSSSLTTIGSGISAVPTRSISISCGPGASSGIPGLRSAMLASVGKGAEVGAGGRGSGAQEDGEENGEGAGEGWKR